jgi:hypothetical protein
MRVPLLVAVLALGLISACARHETPIFTGEPYLLVWAGDADRQNADFLALIDADPTSSTYGKVLRTYPVRSRGNEPHALTPVRADGRVFGSGILANRIFLFDLRKPLAARLLHVDEAAAGRGLSAPQESVSLPNGHVVVACPDRAGYRGDPREVVGAGGGLVELDADGQFVQEVSADDPEAHGLVIAPYGVTLAGNRIVTTNNGHGWAASNRGERMPGISVQIWRANELKLLKTVILDAGPRGEENLAPLAPRAAHRGPMVYVNTDLGGGLYASDSIGTAYPGFRLVFDFGQGSLPGGASITPDDRFYVTTLTGRGRVASLDLGDPYAPKAVSSVRLDGGAPDANPAPHHLAMSADGTRVAVSDYTASVPGFTQEGDHRVHVVRLDPATGRLRLDTAFRDEATGAVGVDFNRTTWPHGATGPARPAGLLFLTEIRSKDED